MTRVALTTLLVSATLPFAAALAQTAAEPDGTPSAPVEVILSGSPAAAPPEAITMPAEPVETAPAPPPATAPVLTSIVTAPTPVEIAPAGPSATAAAPSATPAAEPRVPAKPPKPRAATVVTVVNGRAIPATTITVTAEAKPVSHAGPLAPNAKATLKLPKMKGCLVTVAATFEEGSVSDGAAVDVCKVKLVRLTD